jgi:hypothetical protein
VFKEPQGTGLISRKMRQEHEGNDDRHKNAYRRQPHPPHLFPIEWESPQHGEPSGEQGTLFSHEKGSGRNQRKPKEDNKGRSFELFDIGCRIVDAVSLAETKMTNTNLMNDEDGACLFGRLFLSSFFLLPKGN